jgi:hypothetical protein
MLGEEEIELDGRFAFTGQRDGAPQCCPCVSSLWDLIGASHQLGSGRVGRGSEEAHGKKADGLAPVEPVAILVGVPILSGKGRMCFLSWLIFISDGSFSSRDFWPSRNKTIESVRRFCGTQCPRHSSYVGKSEGAHALRDDGISLHWSSLIGWDRRHRRNPTPPRFGALLSIQAYIQKCT